MPMGRVLGAVALVAGLILLGFGMNASEAPMEQISETFTGRYTDTTMWYLVGGGAAVLGGLVLLLLGRKA